MPANNGSKKSFSTNTAGRNPLLPLDCIATSIAPAYAVVYSWISYVSPAVGATRVAITSTSDAFKGISTQTWDKLNAVAFKNPDGSLVAEIYNKAAAAKTTTVKVGSAFYQFVIPAHGWATLKVAS